MPIFSFLFKKLLKLWLISIFWKFRRKRIFTGVPHTSCYTSNLRLTVLVSLKVPKHEKIIEHFRSLGCKKPRARKNAPCTKAPRTKAPWTKPQRQKFQETKVRKTQVKLGVTGKFLLRKFHLGKFHLRNSSYGKFLLWKNNVAGNSGMPLSANLRN